MKKYLLIFGLLLLVFPYQAWAAAYYVAQNSAGSGNGSSYVNRMSVSSHNSSSFSAGDTIYLCGTITSKITPPSDGANGNPIVYDGDCPGGTLVNIINSSYDGSIRFDGIDYLTFQNITAHGGDTGIATYGASTGITIKRCTLYNYERKGIMISKTSGYRGPDPAGDIYDVTIGGADGDGNEIYDCGNSTAGADISFQKVHNFVISYNKLYGTADPSWGGIDGMALHYSDDGVIEYNKIYSHNDAQKGEDGVDIKQYCNNIDIRYNDIYNHQRQTGITVHFDAYDINIYGNRVYGNKGGILVFDHNTPDMSQPNGNHVHDIKIWGNLIYENVMYGIRATQSTGDTVQDVDIYNNVIAENSGYGGVELSTGDKGHSVKNNIFYKNRSDYVQVSIAGSDVGNVDMDYNYYYWPSHQSYVSYNGGNRTIATLKGSYGIETNGADDNPEMTDPANKDFSLQNTSPCINNGINLGSTFENVIDPNNTNFKATPPIVVSAKQGDYDGWEIGAYVYKQSQTTTTTTTTLIPPKGLIIKPFLN